MPSFDLRDGAAMPYADDGAGPPIVLVHGWAAHGGFFDSLRARLARSWRVITPTLRGHLGARAGALPATIETLGDDIAALIEGLGLDHVAALGWSMGAMALWSAAPRLGDRLALLVIEEMGPKLLNDASWPHGLAGGYGAADVAQTLAEIRSDFPGAAARFAPRMFAPETCAAQPALVAWAASEMTRADPAAMESLWASMAAQDFRAALAGIAAPTLALHGAQSQVYPAGAAEFVARTARDGAHAAIAGAGHVPHLEAPDLFFNHVAEFVRAHRPPISLNEGVVR
jgi:pimeloyl-ACP methyl ester carboxylesterase